MVHLVRNSTKYIPTKHRKESCSDLKAIYGAVSIGEAENSLAVLNEKWGKQYPSAVRVWNDNFVYVQRLFEYPVEIRKMIYTTNAIESFNSALRKVTDRKAAFPNEMAVMKILYLRTLDVVKKWTMPYPNWRLCSEFSVNARFHDKTVHILRSSEPEAEAEPPPMAARSVLDRLA